MDVNAIFRNVRKVYLNENIVENTEECPHCHSIGQRSMLRFFYVNFDEAIYKCSTCMYPFENFKFKNVKDNTLYLYEPMDIDQPVSTDIGEPSCVWHDVPQQNDDTANAAFLAKTFTPSQTNENIEEFDFDFGFLDNIVNDEPLPIQTSITSMNDTCGQPDDGGIDEFLNDLIHGKSDNQFTETMANAVQMENNNQIPLNQFSFVETRIQSLPPPQQPTPPLSALPSLHPPSAITVEKIKVPPVPLPHLTSTASVQLTKSNKKLSKCLKAIAMKTEKKEKKPKRTKNPVPTNGTITKKMEEKRMEVGESTILGEVTKVYSRNLFSTKKLPSYESAVAKEMDVGQKLLTLVQQQDSHKPLDLLQQLKSLDMKKANAPVVRKIIAKSNAVPANPPKIEPKEIVAKTSDVLTPIVTKQEPVAKPIAPSVGVHRCDAVQKPNYEFNSNGCIERRIPPTINGLPDLATFFGFDNFGSISYENLDEEPFGRPLDFDQIVEEEVEIIPIEVGEDSIFDIETETVSNVGEMDLFGDKSFTTVFEVANVGTSTSLVPINEAPSIVAIAEEAPADVGDITAPTKKRRSYKKKESAANTKSKLSNDSQTVDAIIPKKVPIKRSRKQKIVILENGDENIVANTVAENAAAIVATLKPARKPRSKQKGAVAIQASGENLAGFSLNELEESVANAAQKSTKKPRKRRVKATASDTSIDAPSTNVISNSVEVAQELTVTTKAIKPPRKKKVPSGETPSTDVISDSVEVAQESTVTTKAIKPPRKKKVPSGETPSTNVISNSVEVAQESTVTTKAIKPPRKKKVPSGETIVKIPSDMSAPPLAAPKTVKKPRRSKVATCDEPSIDCIASKTIFDAITVSDSTAVVDAKPIASKGRKKKISTVETPANVNGIESPQSSMSNESKKPPNPPKKPRKRKIAAATPSPINKKARKTDIDSTVAAAEDVRGIATATIVAANTDDTKSI